MYSDKEKILQQYKDRKNVNSAYTIELIKENNCELKKNNRIINFNERQYIVTVKNIENCKTKEYLDTFVQKYKKTKYMYITKHFLTKVYLGSYSHQLLRNGDIGWVSGIIVLKKNSKYINKIELTIGNNKVLTIDGQLLLNLFGYDINDNVIYIPIPKNFIINRSNLQQKVHPLDLDIGHMQGIPLFHLIYHEVRINIFYDLPIADYELALEYTSSRYLKRNYGSAKKIYIDDKLDQDRIIEDLHFQIKREDLETRDIVKSEYLSLGLTSYINLKCQSHEFLDFIVKNIKTESLKTLEYFSVIKMCFQCFRTIIGSIPVDIFVDISYVLAFYHAAIFDSLNKTSILPYCLLKILIQYIPFDPNHTIIVYEENEDQIQCYQVTHQIFNFNNGKLQIE